MTKLALAVSAGKPFHVHGMRQSPAGSNSDIQKRT